MHPERCLHGPHRPSGRPLPAWSPGGGLERAAAGQCGLAPRDGHVGKAARSGAGGWGEGWGEGGRGGGPRPPARLCRFCEADARTPFSPAPPHPAPPRAGRKRENKCLVGSVSAGPWAHRHPDPHPHRSGDKDDVLCALLLCKEATEKHLVCLQPPPAATRPIRGQLRVPRGVASERRHRSLGRGGGRRHLRDPPPWSS